MASLLTSLSEELAAAVQVAAPSVVQVHGGRRLAAGVVFDTDLVVTSSRGLEPGTVSVRCADGRVVEGAVVGRGRATSLAVVRAAGLEAPAATPGPLPAPGHLAQAVGRTWSGAIFAAFAPVAVVGGPLRTGRAAEIPQVIRVGIVPHGALTGGALVDGHGQLLGVVSGTAIRGTTVVVPSEHALADARDVVANDGVPQGYLGIGSIPVQLPAAQQAEGRSGGLLVTAVASGGPAEAGGVLVGDVVVAVEGTPVDTPEDLVARLRGRRVGTSVTLTLQRGQVATDVPIAVGERRRG